MTAYMWAITQGHNETANIIIEEEKKQAEILLKTCSNIFGPCIAFKLMQAYNKLDGKIEDGSSDDTKTTQQ